MDIEQNNKADSKVQQSLQRYGKTFDKPIEVTGKMDCSEQAAQLIKVSESFRSMEVNQLRQSENINELLSNQVKYMENCVK